MNETVHTALEGGGLVLASFGSGDKNQSRAARRASGPTGRRAASPQAHAALRRAASAGGRGRTQRRAILQEIQNAAGGRRRLTNRQIAGFHARLRAIRGR